RATLTAAPQTDKPGHSLALPQFIVNIPFVDFSDSTEFIVDNKNKPQTCHHNNGFLLAAKSSGQEQRKLSPVQTHDLLRAAGFGDR
ncbi:MAG: hypothetical protein ACRD3W_02525, partial [Terriglobales bacterium]